jgi:hypothetical protein
MLGAYIPSTEASKAVLSGEIDHSPLRGAIMNQFMNNGSSRDLRDRGRPGRREDLWTGDFTGITLDFININGAIVVAGTEPCRIDLCRLQAKADRELSGSWRTPLVTPETPVATWG